MSVRTLPDDVPHGTALATDDRSHLYDEYGVDPSRDDTEPHRDRPPVDYHERRAAVLAFYGGRCGRCLNPVDRCSPGDGVSLGYLYSVGEGSWALSSLVAVCEGCHDLLTVRTVGEDRQHATPADAPQFPAPLCDPRVAVERAPVTAREVWLCKRLSDRVSDHEDRRVNAPARDCVLGLATNAATATALGATLCEDWTRPPRDSRLVDVWTSLPAATRAGYGEYAVDPDAAAGTASVAATAAVGTGDRSALPVGGRPDHPEADPDTGED